MKKFTAYLTIVGAALLGALAPQSVQAVAIETLPGPAVPGAPGAITNGSNATLNATGSTITAIFIGFSADDRDVLTLPGTNFAPPLINKGAGVTPPGTTAVATGLTAGQLLPFTLTNSVTGNAFVSGANVPNDAPAFSPVYHFADFTGINSLADYNASPLGVSSLAITPGGAVDTFILAHGGYASWLFVGVEDLKSAALDDWNDLAYAFQNVESRTVVPEPASLLLLGSALVGFGIARRWRNRE